MTDQASGAAPQQPPLVQEHRGSPSKEETTMGMLAHLLGLVGFIGPLIIWLIEKDKMPFVDDQGKEALNFQITMLIAFIIAGFTTIIFIGLLLVPGLVVANIVLVIIAALRASAGERYRYPVCIRFIK